MGLYTEGTNYGSKIKLETFWSRHWDKVVTFAICVTVIGLIFKGMMSANEVMNDREELRTKVVSSKNIGKIESLTLQKGGFNTSTVTTIISTEGTYMVYGHFSFTKGDLLTMQTRGDGRNFICINNRCSPVAR